MHFERVYIHRKSTLHMFVSDLKCSSTSRDIAAGFWNRENLENVPHWISGPWSITGTPWIIHRVMIRSCLRLGDISDILRPSFLQQVTESLPTVWPRSMPRNGGVCLLLVKSYNTSISLPASQEKSNTRFNVKSKPHIYVRYPFPTLKIAVLQNTKWVKNYEP